MKKAYVGAIIADIHAGAISGKILKKELKEGFLNYISSMNVLDFVVIAGDLFDTKISLNSDHTKYIFNFISELIDICIDKNAKLRIIKGTESHDNQQLDTLVNLFDINCDIKIINTVEDEWLFDDFRCLYIPEEYMKDQDEYYEPYMKNMYDMIFGHGMVNEVAFVAKNQQSEVTVSRAPIFKTEKLLSICKGPIFFGHIHKAQQIKDDMYYVGSYSRWCFGETEPKGFMTVVYSPKNSAYETEFIENTNARTFNTMVVDTNSKFYSFDDNKQVEYLINAVRENKSDYIRLIFNIPEDYNRPTLLISNINDIFNRQSNVKVIINNNVKQMQQKRAAEERTRALLTTYDFLFDKGTPEDKISKYIRIKFNRDIPVDRMRDILYQKLCIDIDD
jgi:DNA repair exonuclease SbcCD nuclease subunit